MRVGIRGGSSSKSAANSTSFLFSVSNGLLRDIFSRHHFAVLLLILAGTLFAYRGVIRGLSQAGDFSWNYLSTRAWMAGLNPYEYENALLMRGQGYSGWQDLGQMGTPYFPAVFPISAPFALLDWGAAVAAFLAMIVSLIALLAIRADQAFLRGIDQNTKIILFSFFSDDV